MLAYPKAEEITKQSPTHEAVDMRHPAYGSRHEAAGMRQPAYGSRHKAAGMRQWCTYVVLFKKTGDNNLKTKTNVFPS